MNTVILCLLALLLAGMALADEAEHREHGPHVHGVVELNVALDGNVLWIELSSPAMNLVGFEHAPQNAEQKAAVRQATEILEDGARLFVTSSGAGCQLTEAKVTTDVEHPGGSTTTTPMSTMRMTSTPARRTRNSTRAIGSNVRRPMRSRRSRSACSSCFRGRRRSRRR